MPENAKSLMILFMERGAGPGEIAHYIHVDGSGGTVISENDNVAELHDVAMAYARFMDFEILPVRKAEEAVETFSSILAEPTDAARCLRQSRSQRRNLRNNCGRLLHSWDDGFTNGC